MTAVPNHSDEHGPVAEYDVTRVDPSSVTVFRPLDDRAQGGYGTLKESPTNRWRVQQR